VAPNQLVGAVFLSRDNNPYIVDTSGREGLIHGEEFIALKAFLFGCLFRLEAHYHDLFLKRRAQEPAMPSPRETVQEFDTQLKDLTRQLRGVESQLPRSAERSVERVRDRLDSTLSQMNVLQRSMEELASQATIYRGLETLGIASATFGHEVESSLEQFMSSAYTACALLEKEPPALNNALDELSKAINSGKRVGAWGAYALRRVKQDKRRRRYVNITELMGDLVDELRPAIEASNIDLKVSLARAAGRTFPMDVESVLVNLLTNAYYFSKMKRRPRKISISLRPRIRDDEKGFEVAVSDSGPGVSAKIQEHIWQPLFSTKVDRHGRAAGTGLGLSIVDAVVRDIGGIRTVEKDPQLGGARFSVWLRLPRR
jgi:signal transduction histidine kinase